jgi:hypothetical protein
MRKLLTVWFPFVLLGCGLLVGAFSHFAPWILFFSVGVQGLWAGLWHALKGKEVAESIGWQTSPFQFEIAMGNLGMGVAGVLAPWFGFQYWLALSLVSGIFLWGAAYGHAREMIVKKNFAPNNAGPIFYTDILVPLLVWIFLAVGS